jgi:hypothetical protein
MGAGELVSTHFPEYIAIAWLVSARIERVGPQAPVFKDLCNPFIKAQTNLATSQRNALLRRMLLRYKLISGSDDTLIGAIALISRACRFARERRIL